VIVNQEESQWKTESILSNKRQNLSKKKAVVSIILTSNLFIHQHQFINQFHK